MMICHLTNLITSATTMYPAFFNYRCQADTRYCVCRLSLTELTTATQWSMVHLQWSSADYIWYSTPPFVSLSVLVNMSTSHRFFATSSIGCQCLRGLQFKIAALTFDGVRSTGVAYNKYSPEFVLPSTYYIYNLYSPSTYYIYNL